MNINVGIIDQRVRKPAEDLAAEFGMRLNIRNRAGPISDHHLSPEERRLARGEGEIND